MEFTNDQKKIIQARDCNLLVSAAAGSGKTAVMVERIVKLITDKDNPVDIDSFLIVTFTKAAAAQMRDKIADRINELVELEPGNEHLQRQSILIHNALITTIDAFCLYVLKNYFDRVDIEPGFRIADESEIKLLLADVCGEVLEKFYASEDEAFIDMVDSFSLGAEDSTIETIVLDLYEAAMSSPWPEEWLKEHSNDYYVNHDDLTTIYDTVWYKMVLNEIYNILLQSEVDIKNARKLSLRPDGPYMYEEQIDSEALKIESLVEKISNHEIVDFDSLRDEISSITFERLPSCRDKSVNSDVKDRTSALRKDAKNAIEGILKKYLPRSFDANLDQMDRCNEVLNTLIKVTLEFKKSFDAKMHGKGILSFADCEHLALNALIEKDIDDEPISLHNYKTTDVANELRSRFSYVMIDEYQDSNLIQELLLNSVSKTSDGINNRFMVGDVKQSIYRFRQADPEIFLEKYDEYIPEGDINCRIDLHQNFRSRSSVLDCTNAIFSRIMSRDMGGVTYDDTAALHLGADYPMDETQNYGAEFICFDSDADGKISDAEVEACGIADYINSIHGSMLVKNGKENNLRPLKFSDIVILLRSPSGVVDTYRKVFNRYNIPVHITGGVGYFSTYEIRTILHLLRVIVNPLQDISLYGVMESCIGEFSKEEIALIRANYLDSLEEGEKPERSYLYTACKLYANKDSKTKDEQHIVTKVATFVDMIENFREISEYMSTLELIWQIFLKTDYRAKISAMHGGEKRLSNVNMLLKKAAQYGETSYFGLHNFIRYIDLCEKYEIDESEIESVDEHADVVRIMSIHKSKGLEFPVCFVAGMGKKFNLQDARSSVVIDKTLGIGIKDVDSLRRTRAKTLKSVVISDKITKDTVSEELRILYVALTRAQEKLILTGVCDKASQEVLAWKDKISEGTISPWNVYRAGGYMDWLFMCIASTSCAEKIIMGEDTLSIDELCLSYRHMTMEDISLSEIAKEMDIKTLHKEYLLLSKKINSKETECADTSKEEGSYTNYLKELYSQVYPYENLKGLYTKTSVSELKHAAMPAETEAVFKMYAGEGDSQNSEYIPRFISGVVDKPGATLRGSAFHRILELIDWNGLHNDDVTIVRKDLISQMDALRENGRLSKDQRDIFTEKNISLIVNFLCNECGSRMAMAEKEGNLFREAPFMLGLSANILNEKYPEDETVLIQGIIDAYWKEDDGYVILDYKTDRVSNAQELIDRYQTQLDYYEAALNQMHINVKEKLIYSFALNETIRL